MRTTLIGWLEKNNKAFVALLAAGATLAMATLIDASSSSQVEQLAPLAVPRTGHAATVLADGRVLITGGRDSAGIIVATAEVFDPANQTSIAIGMLNTARIDHTATRLADGRVLIAGGTSASGALTSAEIFDPANPGAGFRVLSATMGAARARHTATRLNDGRVLIAGGDADGTAEIFEPTAESFSSTLFAMTVPRTGHTATLFSDDSVLLAGGNTDSMEYFSATDQKFTLDLQKMTAVRTGQEAIALDDTHLLFFGGDSGNTIDEFNTSADTISLKGTMDAPASSATLLANGKILVLRSDLAGLYAPDATDAASAFTPFDETSVPGSTALKRTGQSATELSGDKKILVAGGENAQHQPSLQIVTFNPAKIWTDKDDYQPDDPVLLFGSGWKPNENVYLYAVDSETEQWTYESTIPADGNGEFSVNPYFIVQLRQLGTLFHVTAMGAQSTMQADVEFTDAVNLNSITVGSQTGTAVAGVASSVTYQITASYSGNGTNNDDPVTLSFLGWTGATPAGVTASFSPTTVAQGSPNSTLTLQTSSSTIVAGTYTFTVRGTTAGGQRKDGTGTLTIAAGTATKLALSGSTSSLASGSTRVLTATIQDANGNTVTSGPNSTLSVMFAKTAGVGTVTGLGSTNAVAGVAALTVTGNQLGAVTISASGSALSAGAGNPITFNVVAGAANKLLLSGSTANLAAGTTRTLTATIQDSAGNTITTGADSTLSVTFAKTTGTGSVTGVGSVNAVAGVANITITGATAGSVTIGASGGSLAAGTGNPITFTVVANTTVDHFAFATISSPQTAGTPFNITITAQDAGDNTVTGYSGNGFKVKLTSTGNLVGAPVTTPAFTNGVLTNDSVTITNAGNFTITATDSPATGMSNSFQVNAGAASKLAFLQQPTATSAGQTITPAVTVHIQDANSNPTTSTASVALAIQNNPSSGTLSGTTPVAAVNGVATFSDLSINKGGTGYTLQATSAGLTSATSAAFTINNPAPTLASIAPTNGSISDTFDVVFNGTNYIQGVTTVSFGPNITVNTVSVNSSIKLTANITIGAGAAVGPRNVSVTNPAPGGGTATLTNGFTVNNPATTTVISSSSVNNTSTYGQSVTFTAMVTTASGTPTGSVTFYDSANCSGTVLAGPINLDANRNASFNTSALSASGHTITGCYTPTGIYQASNGSVTQTVNKAHLTVKADDKSKTYDRNTFSPFSATLSGFVSGETEAVLRASGALSGSAGFTGPATTAVNASTIGYTIIPTQGTLAATNYDFPAAGFTNGTLTIGKADATVAVTPYDVTYDDHEHTATYSITGVNGEIGATVGTVDVSNTKHTNVGTYESDYWSFAGTANYNDIATTIINDKIGKDNAAVGVTPYDVTYDGHEHMAAVTSITGVNGETGAAVGTVDVSNTKHTNAGTYSADYWSFTGTVNYNNIAATVITDHIGKADANVVVAAYDVTYDGHDHTATVTSITGVNGEVDAIVGTVDVSHTTHKNAGTYNADYWSFTGTANYNNIAATTITDTIDQVTLTAGIIGDPAKPYDGNTSATLTSANFSLTGLVGMESFTVTQTSGTYNSKDVATAVTVMANLAAGDFTPEAGTLASNSALPNTASGPGHITPVMLTASIVGNPTRPYNGNRTATLTSANFSLSGLIGIENFTVTQTSATYNSKDVATANTVTANLMAGDFTATNGR